MKIWLLQWSWNNDDPLDRTTLNIYYYTFIYTVIWLWNAAFFFGNVFPEAVYFAAGILRKLNSYSVVDRIN